VEQKTDQPWLKFLFQYLQQNNWLVDTLGYSLLDDFEIIPAKSEITSYQTALQNWLYNLINKVNVLDRLSDEHYDNLLIDCIVFADYTDVAASNTILECISRCTPILVPKLPSIIEYLGEEYPLFFTEIKSIPELLTEKNIIGASDYLKKCQQKIRCGNFVRNFTEVLKEYD
jgi:hypothetical protein